MERMRSVDEEMRTDVSGLDEISSPGEDDNRRAMLGNMFLDAFGGGYDSDDDVDVGEFVPGAGGGMFIPDLTALGALKDVSKVEKFVERVESFYGRVSQENSPEVSPTARPRGRRSSMGEDPLLGIRLSRLQDPESPHTPSKMNLRRPSSAESPMTPNASGEMMVRPWLWSH